MTTIYSDKLCLVHVDGDKLYPVKIKNRDTGKATFRVSEGGTAGNLKVRSVELDDDSMLPDLVVNKNYAVRAKSRVTGRAGLYKIGQRSIVKALLL